MTWANETGFFLPDNAPQMRADQAVRHKLTLFILDHRWDVIAHYA
jgi:hypothetical protein